MLLNEISNSIIKKNDTILITGANGFIGVHVVKNLLERGFLNLRCFVRPSSNLSNLDAMIDLYPDATIDFVRGNLTSKHDSQNAVKDIKIIFHLAAGRGKSYADTYSNSVVTTKNLLEAAKSLDSLLRFVNISSFAVYTNAGMKRNSIIDEQTQTDNTSLTRFDPYTFAKLEQERILVKLCSQWHLNYVIVRPGAVLLYRYSYCTCCCRRGKEHSFR